MPTLCDVRQFVTFGALVYGSSDWRGTVGKLDMIKDVGGSVGTVFEAANANHRLAGEARALAGAAAHAKIAGQIGFELVRARIAVSQAEEISRRFRSPAAESALAFMRPELHRLQAAFDAERAHQLSYQSIANRLRAAIGDGKASRIGEVAIAAEKTASRSALGRALLGAGRFMASKEVTRSLTVLGIALASFKGFSEAPTKAVGWKLAGGATQGAFSFAADRAVTSINPAAALIDPAIKFGAKAMGAAEAGDHLTIGTFYDDCGRIIVSLTQAMTTGDASPLNELHRRSMAGEGSTVLRGYAAMGDALSRTALMDTALTKAADWANNVPAEFRSSSTWWSAVSNDASSVIEAGRGAVLSLADRAGAR
jgi:hypothetical protein